MNRPNDVAKTLAQIEKLVRQLKTSLRDQEQMTVAAFNESVSAIPDWP